MPALRALSILTLLACAAYATSGFAQEPDGVEETTRAETTVLGAEGARENSGIEFSTVDSLRVPCACDAEATDGKREAYQAAQADPGILMYTEPPAGTEMPIHEPPEDVDPEMIWPVDPSLEPPENLDLEEIRPFDPRAATIGAERGCWGPTHPPIIIPECPDAFCVRRRPRPLRKDSRVPRRLRARREHDRDELVGRSRR